MAFLFLRMFYLVLLGLNSQNYVDFVIKLILFGEELTNPCGLGLHF